VAVGSRQETDRGQSCEERAKDCCTEKPTQDLRGIGLRWFREMSLPLIEKGENHGKKSDRGTPSSILIGFSMK